MFDEVQKKQMPKQLIFEKLPGILMQSYLNVLKDQNEEHQHRKKLIEKRKHILKNIFS